MIICTRDIRKVLSWVHNFFSFRGCRSIFDFPARYSLLFLYVSVFFLIYLQRAWNNYVASASAMKNDADFSSVIDYALT